MYVLITELILMGCLTYVTYKYTNLVSLYNALDNEAHNLRLNLEVAEKNEAADAQAYAAALNLCDSLEDQLNEYRDKDFATEVSEILACECDAMDDDACRCIGLGAEATYEYDNNGNLVGPDGFTYTTTPSDEELEATGIYSEDGNVQLDRIKWTPDNLYTPDVDSDEDDF